MPPSQILFGGFVLSFLYWELSHTEGKIYELEKHQGI